MESTASVILILFMGLQASSVIGDLSSVNGTDSPSKMLEAFERELNSQFRTPYGYNPSGNQTRNDDKENQGREESGVKVDRKKRSMREPSMKYLRDARVMRDRDGNMYDWKRTTMTWIIQGSLNRVPHPDLLDIIRTALSLWQPLLPFEFLEQTEMSWDINLLFVFQSFAATKADPMREDFWHGDKQWFNETLDDERYPNKSIAHSLIPGYYRENMHHLQRAVHFDADHDWTYQLVYDIAIHGIGHALGLAHSDDFGAVMYPHYRHLHADELNFTEVESDTKLTIGDLQSVEKIYGLRDGFPTRYRCDDMMRRKIHSVIRVRQERHNDYYMAFFEDKVKNLRSRSSPVRRVDEVFQGLPTNYDMVFTAYNSEFDSIFFVAGDYLYQYNVADLTLQNKVLKEGFFPVPPKFAVNTLQPNNSQTDALLFGETYFWEFFFHLENPRSHMHTPQVGMQRSMDIWHSILSVPVKFAVIHELELFWVSRNDSYYLWSLTSDYRRRLRGVPLFMKTTMCPGLIPTAISMISGTEGSIHQKGMLRPSLVLVIMLSLIKLY